MTAAQTTGPRHLPIAFSDALICAILAGTKTQTRRVIAPQPRESEVPALVGPYHPTIVDRHGEEQPGPVTFGASTEDGERAWKCPYGAPGTVLWVREGLERDDYGLVRYRADGLYPVDDDGDPVEWTWKPRALAARYCPRVYSRIDLEVTEVRVQRVQEISEEDARAEGVEPLEYVMGDGTVDPDMAISARVQFRCLWNAINGKRPGCSWDANPWTWAISFRKVRP